MRHQHHKNERREKPVSGRLGGGHSTRLSRKRRRCRRRFHAFDDDGVFGRLGARDHDGFEFRGAEKSHREDGETVER